VIGRLFKETSDTVHVQVFRYILAGTAAYALDYSALVVFTEIIGLYYLTSAALAFLLGAIASYIMNVTWVFNDRAFKNRRLEFTIFISISIAGLFLNHYCIKFFTESVNMHYLTSKLISSVLVSAVNFSARKYILFR